MLEKKKRELTKKINHKTASLLLCLFGLQLIGVPLLCFPWLTGKFDQNPLLIQSLI
ncbi:hypothetical protein MUP95_06360 [bacterium]|nr:hypothetical protein [bacterium]